MWRLRTSGEGPEDIIKDISGLISIDLVRKRAGTKIRLSGLLAMVFPPV